MNHNKIRPLVLFTSLASLPLLSLPAAAAPALEEIIVTAQKREESLSDVPISIVAISGDRLNQSGIKDLSQLSEYVPNLVISESTISSNIYMRGVGSGINRAFEQSVGMFIDGIYMGRSRQYRSAFLDLERVEVLRGPQGILFGKNTIAGALKLTTAKPTPGEELNGSLMLEYGTYDSHNAVGILSGGLSDTVGLRLAVKDSSSDGWVKDTFQNVEAPDSDEQLVRLAFSWKPSDDLQLNGKVEHSEFESTGYSLQSVGLEPLGGLAEFTAAQIYAADPRFETRANDLKSTDGFLADDSRETDVDNAALNIDYMLGDHKLTLVTGYSAYEFSDRLDADFAPIKFLSTNDDSEYDQWSQEIRLTSPGAETFDYITGLYWQTNELKTHFWSDVDVAVIDPVLSAVYGTIPCPAGPDLSLLDCGLVPTNFSRDTNFSQETDTYSAFFQGTWAVTDTLRLIFGGRYTKEEKDFYRSSAITPFQDLGVVGGPQEQTMAAVLQVAVQLPEYSEKRTESHFTPSLKAQWDISDDVMLYGLVENGFKSGGFNANADATAENQEFEEEEALGMEMGMKATLLDGRARLNAAIFRTNYDDLQVTTWNGFAFVVGNAAESVSQGIELDGEFAISDYLTAGVAIAYLDSHYESFETAGCPAATIAAGQSVCDLTDETTPFSPEYSGNLFVNYVWPFENGMELRVGADLNYSDEFYVDSDLDENLKQDSYYKINAYVALAGADDRWEVAVIGKNITDETTISVGLDQPLIAGGYTAFVENPREVMVRLKLAF